MSAPASCRCGAEWTGSKIEHCLVCHSTFTCTRAGDKHRVGDHAVFKGPNRRRCLSEMEMLERGMGQNWRGHWMTTAEKQPKSLHEHSSDGLTDFGWGPVPLEVPQGPQSEFGEEAS